MQAERSGWSIAGEFDSWPSRTLRVMQRNEKIQDARYEPLTCFGEQGINAAASASSFIVPALCLAFLYGQDDGALSDENGRPRPRCPSSKWAAS